MTVAKPTAPINPIIPLPKRIINSQAVLDSVADRRRIHLGFAYYQTNLRPGGEESKTREPPTRRGFASTTLPLPRFEGKENCTFTIKVSRAHLVNSSREEITRRRGLWGTDIYTDDSDIIAACIHEGWFRGAWPKSVDTSYLGLEIDVPGEKRTSVEGIMNRPPPTGPIVVPARHEVHITVLILPPMEKYHSTTRFGIRSREWGGKHGGYQGVHDGLSFKIMSVEFVAGVDGQEARSGAARKQLFRMQLKAQETEEAENEQLSLPVRPGKELDDESSERGGDGIWGIGDIKGIGSKSWNRPKIKNPVSIMKGDKAAVKNTEGPVEEPEAAKEAEVDIAKQPEPKPEPQQESPQIEGSSPEAAQTENDAVQKVTQRMIENANSHSRHE